MLKAKTPLISRSINISNNKLGCSNIIIHKLQTILNQILSNAEVLYVCIIFASCSQTTIYRLLTRNKNAAREVIVLVNKHAAFSYSLREIVTARK